MSRRVKFFKAVSRFRAPFFAFIGQKMRDNDMVKIHLKKYTTGNIVLENVLMFNVRLAFNQKSRLQLRFRQPQRHISDLERADLLQNQLCIDPIATKPHLNQAY